MRIRLLGLFAVTATVTCSNALASTDEFQDALAKAARISTLTAPGAKPFYSNFAAWNRKQIPRRAEVAENGTRRMLVDIDKIEPPGNVSDSLLVLEGVKPEILGAPGGGSNGDQSSDLVVPKPIRRVSPEYPAYGHGTILVDVVLDAHGHVVDAKIKQSSGEALDAAALRAAMQWEFTPMMIKGVAVPGHATLRFDF